MTLPGKKAEAQMAQQTGRCQRYVENSETLCDVFLFSLRANAIG